MPAPRSTWLGLPAVLIAGLAAAQPASAAAPTAKITNKVLQITGDATAQRITLRNLASDHTRLLIDVGDDGTADFNFSRTAFTTIQAGLGGGNDSLRIDDANGAVTATRPATVDGGAGNDSFRGGAGAETFLGGDGNDVAIGDGGNDVLISLGAGDDEARWAPGDGNDTVEGQDGQDRLTRVRLDRRRALRGRRQRPADPPRTGHLEGRARRCRDRADRHQQLPRRRHAHRARPQRHRPR